MWTLGSNNRRTEIRNKKINHFLEWLYRIGTAFFMPLLLDTCDNK
jgi:hypothetical protein